jgi:methylenetetrahydrofolate dehydrogenase (NADP+)/methenyltetrahydrofolate cyclohydrolase
LTAQILSGREVAAAARAEVTERVATLAGKSRSVGLATVLVGEDEASQVYVRYKHKDALAVGMESCDNHIPASATPGNRAVETIDPAKDADGLHPHNLGLLLLDRPGPRPATPSGVMRILEHYGIETSGRRAVVVGRSFLVGRPLALLLGAKGVDATVVQAHSRTPDLAAVTREADILVAAVGRPRMLTAEFIKPGATVIDVGINRLDEGLVGDVAYDAAREVAGAITPVPGGVGPMTRASLLLNTVAAAEQRV